MNVVIAAVRSGALSEAGAGAEVGLHRGSSGCD